MRKTALSFIIVILAATTINIAYSQEVLDVKSHNLIIKGTSNLHDWTADAQKVNGNVKVTLKDGKIKSVDAVDLRVDSESLKGSKGSIMDNKIDDALKAKKHPTILFKSTGKSTIIENAGNYRIKTTGVLTIAGTSKNVTIEANGKVLPNGEIEFIGTKKLKMTDFNIKPPTAMLGTLTTGDEVTLQYEVVVENPSYSQN